MMSCGVEPSRKMELVTPSESFLNLTMVKETKIFKAVKRHPLCVCLFVCWVICLFVIPDVAC